MQAMYDPMKNMKKEYWDPATNDDRDCWDNTPVNFVDNTDYGISSVRRMMKSKKNYWIVIKFLALTEIIFL